MFGRLIPDILWLTHDIFLIVRGIFGLIRDVLRLICDVLFRDYAAYWSQRSSHVPIQAHIKRNCEWLNTSAVVHLIVPDGVNLTFWDRFIVFWQFMKFWG